MQRISYFSVIRESIETNGEWEKNENNVKKMNDEWDCVTSRKKRMYTKFKKTSPSIKRSESWGWRINANEGGWRKFLKSIFFVMDGLCKAMCLTFYSVFFCCPFSPFDRLRICESSVDSAIVIAFVAVYWITAESKKRKKNRRIFL